MNKKLIWGIVIGIVSGIVPFVMEAVLPKTIELILYVLYLPAYIVYMSMSSGLDGNMVLATIIFAIYGFIVGIILGWIYGKIKGRKMAILTTGGQVNSKVTIAVAIIAVIVIAGVVYSSANVKKSEDNLVTSIDTTSWKTYTNPEFGYEVSYPSTWEIRMTPGGSTVIVNSERGGKSDTDEPSENIVISLKESTVMPCEASDWKVGFGDINYSTYCFRANLPMMMNATAFDEQGKSVIEKIVSTFSTKSNSAPISNWKTYTSAKEGYTFEYPAKLTLTSAGNVMYLLHEIPFENRDGGCDMKGDSPLSKTLNDFNLSVEVVNTAVKPPYVDGTFSKGNLVWEWAYMGAEGCGETKYYFPMKGNRTVVITKQELQILSPVVTKEVRDKVLAVPGVISHEESQAIVERILSTFKFTN